MTKAQAIEMATLQAMEIGLGADIYGIICSIEVLSALSDEEKENVYDVVAERVDNYIDELYAVAI